MSKLNALAVGASLLTDWLCQECNQYLTNEEIHYYETRCERCETEWLEEIEAWRNGKENETFDRLYSTIKSTLN